MASWAFLSFAAETIFMAEVICMVDEIELMRFLSSLRLAMSVLSCAYAYLADNSSAAFSIA